ncbi:Zn finger-containing GTPase- Activating Protein for ARF [Dimargaris cristalligena]|nr:Zn finger-containing GTPase- Activating Protein for ARF [Dimargaris cristalligena]
MSDPIKRQLNDLLRVDGNKSLAPSEVSMDKWSAEQVKRMQLGGNKKALAFFKSQPDYENGMSIQDKYNSDFAEQWRQKLNAECEGRSYTLTSAPRKTGTRPGGPLRTMSSPSGHINRSGSQSSMNSIQTARANPRSTGTQDDLSSFSHQKSRNENYFAQLGAANETRSAELPPSQGGKYVGFGSTPQPASSANGSFSAQDLINDPSQLLSKGWSLFSSTAQSAIEIAGTMGEKIAENVVRPATETVQDPQFADNVRGYVSDLGQRGSSLINSYFGQGGASSSGSYTAFGNQDPDHDRAGLMSGEGPGHQRVESFKSDTSDFDDFFSPANKSQATRLAYQGRPGTDDTDSATSLAGSVKTASPKPTVRSTTAGGSLTARSKKSSTPNTKNDWNDSWDDF